MNRNQKIAIGCGGAGCLGLLVVAVIGVCVYFWYGSSTPVTNRNVNVNINSNRDSNVNSSSDDSPSTNSSNSSEAPSSSMSDDDRHKLFQAASATGDAELILRVNRKIGFSVANGSDYETFVRDHVTWALNNTQFIVSVSTPDAARAYVDEHLDD
jgi:hypothetical protein